MPSSSLSAKIKVLTDKFYRKLFRLRDRFRCIVNKGEHLKELEVYPSSFVSPHYGLLNKQWNMAPFDHENIKYKFTRSIESAMNIVEANKPHSGALLCDDMFVWFRNLGFLSDSKFIDSMGEYAFDRGLCARIWRIYTLCWAANSCLGLDGDYLDIGCYDGRTVEIIEKYCDFRDVESKKYFLYDIFDNPPSESKKAGHGPSLYSHVSNKFKHFGNFEVIKGAVPDSFANRLPKLIAFAQIDLNSAEADLGAFEAIYDRLAVGAIVVFDDFGFNRYSETYQALSAFVISKSQMIWESPTMQGIFIKR